MSDNNARRYYGGVIRSFADNDTERVWRREFVRSWSRELQQAAYRKLVLIDSATGLNDLQSLPGNRLEKLVGDRAGQYSIRVNDRWRICFIWRKDDAYEVEIVDYH